MFHDIMKHKGLHIIKQNERKVSNMNRLLDAANLAELLGKKEEKKKCNVVLWVFAVIGALAAIAAIAYALCRYFRPEVLEELEDEFEEMVEDTAEEDAVFEDEGIVIE